MSVLTQNVENGIMTVTLQRPKANALNAELVQGLQNCIDTAASDDTVGALVLASGCEGFFSVGLDLREVSRYSRDTMRTFWADFAGLYTSLHELPKPTVAALNGHTMAGGLILALACDFRIAGASESTRFAVSGINMGLALPPEVYAMSVQAMGHAHTRRLFLTGEQIDLQTAAATGLVSEIVPMASLAERAFATATELAGKHAGAYAEIKAMARTAAGYENRFSERDVDGFLDRWFSDELVAIRDDTIARLGGGES